MRFMFRKRRKRKSKQVTLKDLKKDFDKNGEKTVISHAVETKVSVNPMSTEEIQKYIESKEPMDKAGAYGIQGRFSAFIETIEGDYFNVVGLPVSYVYQVLKELGEV